MFKCQICSIRPYAFQTKHSHNMSQIPQKLLKYVKRYRIIWQANKYYKNQIHIYTYTHNIKYQTNNNNTKKCK